MAEESPTSEIPVQNIPIPPPKSSDEILCELFGAFNATPPSLDNISLHSASTTSHKSHKKHTKHSKKKLKKTKKKKRSASISSKDSKETKKLCKKHKKSQLKHSTSDNETSTTNKNKKKRKLGKYSASDSESEDSTSKKKKLSDFNKTDIIHKIKVKQEKEDCKIKNTSDSLPSTSTIPKIIKENNVIHAVGKIVDNVIDNTKLSSEESGYTTDNKSASQRSNLEKTQLTVIKEEVKCANLLEKPLQEFYGCKEPPKSTNSTLDSKKPLPVADVFAEDLIDCGIQKETLTAKSDKPKAVGGKIIIQNLKYSQVYEATVKQIEEEAKLKAEKYEEGELSDSSESNRSPSPISSGSVEEIVEIKVEKEKKRHRRHHHHRHRTSSKEKHVSRHKVRSHSHHHRRHHHHQNSKERSGSKDNSRKSSNDRSKSNDRLREQSNNRSHSTDRMKERGSSKETSRSNERVKERNRSKGRSKSNERLRERGRSRERSRSKDSLKERDRNKHRSRSIEKTRDISLGRSRSKEKTRDRSKDRSRSKERRSEKQRHGRGHSHDRNKRKPEEKIDKQKLLEIARKNALNMMKHPSEQTKVAITSGGKTVNELTDFCKLLSKKDADGHESISSNTCDSSDSESEKPFHHPFQLKDRPSGIVLNIRNSVALPVKSLQEKTAEQSRQLRLQFPVSSGQHHRKTESEWIPVSPKKAEVMPPANTQVAVVKPTAKPARVFRETPNPVAIDIGSIVSQRLSAMRRLQENPTDPEALTQMYAAQQSMQNWAESKQQAPGQFTGTTGVKVLSQAELAAGYQAWARRDQLQVAAPVTTGMGMALLQKMGWRPGEGLGKNKEGTLQPLLLEVKMDKKGLVAQEELPVRQPHQIVRGPPRSLEGKHPVSLLNEYCSRRKLGPPFFDLVDEAGPDHKKNFLFKVRVNGVEYKPAVGSPKKKQARAEAAEVCLKALGILPK